MVNILLVSHSQQLAEATIHFVSEMKNGDFKFEFVGGMENGKSFGSDPMIIKDKILELTKDKELLIVYDLGSSQMNTDMAISMLEPDQQAKVAIAKCAFVEGTLIAVVSNTGDINANALKELVESQAKMEK
jgi:dihydroxyacetone kinase phosphotransfer subunit